MAHEFLTFSRRAVPKNVFVPILLVGREIVCNVRTRASEASPLRASEASTVACERSEHRCVRAKRAPLRASEASPVAYVRIRIDVNVGTYTSTFERTYVRTCVRECVRTYVTATPSTRSHKYSKTSLSLLEYVRVRTRTYVKDVS